MNPPKATVPDGSPSGPTPTPLTPTTEDEMTPEQRSNKIAALLEKHDLYLEWFKVFCRYILTLKDGTKHEIWHDQGINAENLCDRLLDFLENYDKQHTTERPTTDETLRVGAPAQPQRPDNFQNNNRYALPNTD